MDLGRRCVYIANSYYNKGLMLAKQRDLTGACEALKRSLRFDKRQIQARNLLGLIYYEIGEVSDALVQWVLSLNIKPNNNDADRYISELQRANGYIDSKGNAIEKFNQALGLAQSGSDDLAVLQLIKITESHKNYLKAHLLLGLLYFANEDYQRAYRYMQNVLRIDKGNPLAIKCVDDIKVIQRDSPRQKSKKAIRNILPSEKSKSEEYIVPEPYKENSGVNTLVNIFVGLLIGAAAVFFIVMPARQKIIANEYNAQVISISNKLEDANGEIKDLNKQIEEKDSNFTALKDEKDNIDDGYISRLSSFQKLSGALRYMQDDDVVNAARLYAKINPEEIVDIQDGSVASVEQYYNEIKEFFDGDGYVQVTGNGDKLFESEDYDGALELYDLSLAVHEDNPAAMYKKGLCYVKKGDTATANDIFTEVINTWPDNNIADMAKLERGY